MVPPLRVALFGFSDTERNALAGGIARAGRRASVVEWVAAGAECDVIIADADHAPSVQLVLATERLHETVFVGRSAPAGAAGWTPRPIDPPQVLRAVEVLLQRGAASGATGSADVDAPGAALAAAPGVPRPPPRTLARVSAPCALIVDDSSIARRFLASRLLPWGLAVDGVAGSGEALERLARQHHDFAFVDVELGDGSEFDGLRLCQHIKRHLPRAVTQLVLVSAHHSELDRVRGMLAGCDAYLGKPLRAAELDRLLLRQGLQAPQAPAAPPQAVGTS